MHKDPAYWILVAFLSLCFVAMVVEIIGHVKDRKREKALEGFFVGFLKSIFAPRCLEDEVTFSRREKKVQRPS
jgi:hypothetical protein